MSSINTTNINLIVNKLNQNIRKYNIFIESGTLGGQTVVNLQKEFQILHTIELSKKYFDLFDKIKQEKNYFNIKNHFGDTVEVLPKILQSLNVNDKAIFWLDGHWSSFDTARGSKDCPLIEECLSIDLIYNACESIILIDDYRLFGTHHAEDWSNITIENILKCFKRYKIEKHFVHDDILVLYIKKYDII